MRPLYRRIVPFGYRRGDLGELASHKAEQAALYGLRKRRCGLLPRQISHEGVKGVLATHTTTA
jgi:hypothetical protein